MIFLVHGAIALCRRPGQVAKGIMPFHIKAVWQHSKFHALRKTFIAMACIWKGAPEGYMLLDVVGSQLRYMFTRKPVRFYSDEVYHSLQQVDDGVRSLNRVNFALGSATFLHSWCVRFLRLPLFYVRAGRETKPHQSKTKVRDRRPC